MTRSMGAVNPVEPLKPRLLQWGLDGILFFLVVFTPLAFGSVEYWGVAVIEVGAAVAFLVWAVLVLDDQAAGRGGSLPSRIAAPVHSAGVAVALVAFVCTVLVQLLPLPPVLMRLLSPTTHRIYGMTLPQYSAGERVDFGRLEPWLLQNAGAGPGQASELAWSTSRPGELTFSSWRPSSLVPSATRHSLVLFSAYLLLFIIVVDRAGSPMFIRRFLWAVALTGVLVSLLGLAQRTTWGDSLYGQVRPAYGGQPMGPFVNANHFAGYLELALPVLLGLWIAHLRRETVTGARRHRAGAAGETGQKYVPQLFVLSMMLLVSGLAFWGSRSRGGIAAMALAVGAFTFPTLRLWKADRPKKVLAAITLLLLLAGAVTWKVQSLSTEESLDSSLASEPSLGKRFDVWRASAGMLLRFLPLGAGLGTYGYVIPLYQGGGYDRLWIYAHNDYVQLACEVGLLGVTCFLAGLLVFVTRNLLPFLRSPLLRGGAGLGCALGICSLLLHSLVDFNLQIPSNGLLFVLLGGVLVACATGAAPGAERQVVAGSASAGGNRRWLRGALVAVTLAASVLGVAHAAARALQERATALYWGGNLEDARAKLEQAIRLAPGQPDLQADYGYLHLRALEDWNGAGQRLGIEREQALQRARDAFCRAIDLNPVNTFFWSGLAEVYRNANNAKLLDGVQDIETFLESTPGVAVEERLYLGTVRRMMKLEPQNPYHHDRLGEFLWETGNRQGALGSYAAAVRILPKIEEHSFLGGQSTPAEVLQTSIQAIEQAISEDRSGVPEHEMHLNASLLYERAGDLKSALQHMEQARSLLPRKDWYELRLGYLYFSAGDLDRSRSLLSEAVKKGARSEYPYMLLASIARKKGELEVALGNYRKALGANPDNGRVAVDLAALYDEMGDQRNANRYYDLAVELMPGDVTTLISVVDYYARKGLVARTIPILEKVVSLRPHEEVYKERLEQFRARAGLLQ